MSQEDEDVLIKRKRSKRHRITTDSESDEENSSDGHQCKEDNNKQHSYGLRSKSKNIPPPKRYSHLKRTNETNRNSNIGSQSEDSEEIEKENVSRKRRSIKHSEIVSDEDASEECKKSEPHTPKKPKKIKQQKLRCMSHSRLKNKENIFTSDDSDSEFSQSTPRKSKRLKRRTTKHNSFSLPNSKEYIEEKTTPTKFYSPRPERSRRVNNFIRERHTYNTEKRYDPDGVSYSSSSSEDDFIDDSELIEQKKKQKPKVKMKTKWSHSSHKKTRKKISSTSNSSSNEDDIELDSDFDILSDNQVDNKHSTTLSLKILPERESNKRKYKREVLEHLKTVRKASTLNERKILRGQVLSSSEDEVPRNTDIVLEDDDIAFINDDDPHTDDNSENDTSFEKTCKFKRIKSESSDDGNDKEYLLNAEEKLFLNYVREGNLTQVQTFLSENPSLVHANMSNEQTPLHLACINGFSEIVNELLTKNANCHAIDKYKLTPLSHAMLHKHFDCFKSIYEKSKKKLVSQQLLDDFDGKTVLHFLMIPSPCERDFISDLNSCIKFLHSHDKNYFYDMLKSTDEILFLPFMSAIQHSYNKTLELLLNLCPKEFWESNKDLFKNVTPEGGNIIHFAVQYDFESFRFIVDFCMNSQLEEMKIMLNEGDNHGFTPLMYACELEKEKIVEFLLGVNANLSIKGSQNVTALHLAAASGNKRIIELLLEYGHNVGCLDSAGWPPILYANFKAKEDCVLLLMKADPKQIFSLGNLVKTEDEGQNQKNRKVIQSTLECISNVDSYYNVFNEFIKHNFSILDDYNHGVFMKTWKRILSFQNKLEWLHRKCKYLRNDVSYTTIHREDVIGSIMDSCVSFPSIQGLQVKFANEPGMCLGPKRELLSCLSEEIASHKKHLFIIGDNHLHSPYPNTYFADRTLQKLDEAIKEQEHIKTENQLENDEISDLEMLNFTRKIEIRSQLKKIQREMEFVGQFISRVILDRENSITLHLAEPFVKQILGVPLQHDKELETFDHTFYKSIQDNDMDDLFLPFSMNLHNEWTDTLEIIDLKENEEITNENKAEYLSKFSLFKFETSIQKEIQLFKKGFYKNIPSDYISMFTPDEFSLLLNGVSKIDVDSWMQNTKYCGDLNPQTDIIVWFWNLVRSMKEEEKALLLKFATGSPCLPIGGFKNLIGLGGGICHFTIKRQGGKNMLPCAGTCFNSLSLSNYDSEKELREKVLIAIRHGCEGFGFA